MCVRRVVVVVVVSKVRLNRDLCVMILSIWSWSLLQFTLVLTATKERKDRQDDSTEPWRTLLTTTLIDPYCFLVNDW